MTEPPVNSVEALDDLKHFQVEHRKATVAYGHVWFEVGAIDMDGEYPSARDALLAWAGEQTEEPPLGRYRVIDRHGYITEFDVSEHRERVVDRVERAQLERARRAQESANVVLDLAEMPAREPTWQCEFCGKFYSERTAKDHAYCVQAADRRDAESTWSA